MGMRLVAREGLMEPKRRRCLARIAWAYHEECGRDAASSGE